MLKLNDDKIEIKVIRIRQQKNKIGVLHININGMNIALTSTVHNVGVIFDSEMSMNVHVSSINRSA